MRVRAALAAVVCFGAVSHFVACVSAHSEPPVAQEDASFSEDASFPVIEASTSEDGHVAVDAGTDAPTESDDAGSFDATVTDASDAAVMDASDAGADVAVVGVALQLDGVDDQVVMATVDGGANEAAFTTEIWFNTTNPTGSLFEVYGGGGADRFLVIESGAVCFYVFGTPTTLLCSPIATYADGAWHHAAGTLGAVSGMCLYVDGALSASQATPTSSAFNYDTNFRLGYGHTDLNSTLVYFGGKLAESRVWSVERSASEILANYKTHLPGTTTGLQGYWKLDERGTTATAADSTPNGNDGTLENFTFAPSPWVDGGPF